MMSRKDYELVADTINAVYHDPNTNEYDKEVIKNVVLKLGDAFKYQNVRFDWLRFARACFSQKDL